MADEIAAFANARGGVILIGVDDDGTIVGLDRQELDATEETVVQICRDTSGWASFFVRTEPLRLRRIEKS
jgi:predicted HTH transcriptional regulator